MCYGDFVAPLVKAVQELSKQNDDLWKKNAELESKLDKILALLSLHAAVAGSNVSSNITGLIGAKLEQNIPNPFTGITSIAYYLPTRYKTAYINFYSSDGALLKSMQLNTSGKGTITLKSGELPSGSYQYALLIDGKVVDSKQMIETK